MTDEKLQLRIEQQQNSVADEVSALTAVVRPILEGTLFALKGDLVSQVGGHPSVSLAMLARLYRPGDGDCGLCFEWAVHDAMNRRDPLIVERVADAMSLCRVPGSVPASILFGAEKSGALKLVLWGISWHELAEFGRARLKMGGWKHLPPTTPDCWEPTNPGGLRRLTYGSRTAKSKSA